MTTAPLPLQTVPLPGSRRSVGLRRVREAVIMALLVVCGVFTVAITFSIIGILAEKTFEFFQKDQVSIGEFLLGLEWNPLLGDADDKHFGIWPLVCGTMLVAVIAMAVALPLGLTTAVWLSEYAPESVRSIIKPTLEVLAGVPTVVFGFFALTVITPMLRMEWIVNEMGDPVNPLGFENYNVMAAGIAVGILCLPVITSLTEDSLRAVPRALREAAYALGATRFETSWRVVVPAATSGIVAATLLAIARAVGETMIVALASGGLKQLTLDVRQSVQPLTGFMVEIFFGEAPATSVEFLSSYAVAATLFVMTFILTLVGHWVRKRFQEEYE